MEQWINSLISFALGPIRDLVQGAIDRITSVYRSFTDAFWRLRAGFLYWAEIGRSWAAGQIRHAIAVANHLRWLAFVDLPNRAAAVLRDAVNWAAGQLAWLRDVLRAEIQAARDWLVARIQDVIASLGRLYEWALARLAEIVAVVNRLLDRVFGVLGTPERLVAWVLAPLITALVAWFWSNIDQLAEQAWRRRKQIEVRALRTVEDILDRLL